MCVREIERERERGRNNRVTLDFSANLEIVNRGSPFIQLQSERMTAILLKRFVRTMCVESRAEETTFLLQYIN